MENDAAHIPISDLFVNGIEHTGDSSNQQIQKFLQAVRKHLGLDVAFVAEFIKGHRTFRFVDSRSNSSPIQVGCSAPLEQSLCQRVVDGRLPGLMQDAMQCPAAKDLLVKISFPVGAHLSIPITLSDNTLYGTFCCFGFDPDLSLNSRDLEIMKVFADLIADQIERARELSKLQSVVLERIQAVLERDALSVVYQPIYDLKLDRVVGFESLARFTAAPERTPDVWFKEAFAVDLGIQLELKAVQLGLAGLEDMPSDMYYVLPLGGFTPAVAQLPDAQFVAGEHLQ